MSILNKHFWKIAAGFLGILAFSVGALLGFEYWMNYQAEEELKTLLREADQKGYDNYRPVGTSTPDTIN